MWAEGRGHLGGALDGLSSPLQRKLCSPCKLPTRPWWSHIARSSLSCRMFHLPGSLSLTQCVSPSLLHFFLVGMDLWEWGKAEPQSPFCSTGWERQTFIYRMIGVARASMNAWSMLVSLVLSLKVPTECRAPLLHIFLSKANPAAASQAPQF